MKTIKTISLVMLMLAFAINISQAQTDYKGHKIDASGKITDKDGKHIGNVTKDGAITDASGKTASLMQRTIPPDRWWDQFCASRLRDWDSSNAIALS